MSVENSGDTESQKSNLRYFIGNLDDPAFKERRGYFVGFFMRGETFPDGRSLDILSRDDVECAVMHLPEVDMTRPHYHPQAFEITYCIKGRLRLVIDGENVELTENQFMIIPPGVVLQNPENDPETKIFVVKVPSVPGDKSYE